MYKGWAKIKKLRSLWLVMAMAIMVSGCATSNIFQALGDNIAAPNGMVIDSAANRLYLINSNSNVLYDWQQGSIQVYDLTDPLHPVLLGTAPTYSFSGDAYLDTTRNLLYTTNRYSESTTDNRDNVLIMNTDETSTDFLSVSSVEIDKDPYGLYCCYPADRMWIATEDDKLDYLDLATLTGSYIDLQTPLSTGGNLTDVETSIIAVIGSMAFLPRLRDGILVVNLDEAGDPTKYPVDYFIQDVDNPAGIATDGTLIYMVDTESVDGDWTPLLLIIDPSSLIPRTDNDSAEVLDKETDGLLLAQIEVGKKPQLVFLTSQYAWVTSWDKNVVTVVDLATRTKVTDITVGDEPFNMALYAPGGVEKYLYVGNIESNTLSIIDVGTLTVVGTYP